MGNKVISLKKFAKSFCEVDINPSTHEEFIGILKSNGLEVPKIREYFITAEEIRRNEVIFVKDSLGKIIVYRNPKILNIGKLMKELSSSENKIKCIENRIKYLQEYKENLTKETNHIDNLINQNKKLLKEKRNKK